MRLIRGREDRNRAEEWASRMLRIVERSPTDLVLVLADLAREKPPLTGAFLAELTIHLQGQGPHLAFARSWLDHRLAEQGLAIERLVEEESRLEAADQVSIGNSINSLRSLSSTDWREFVERHSVVERALRDDRAGVYADMDFATRDRYRHAVESIARRSGLDEEAVAYEGGALQVTEKIHGVSIPGTIREVIMARIDRLDEPLKTVFQIASVIGKSFDSRIPEDL